MGTRNAQDIAESTRIGMLRLDIALEYHLTCNHYPPIPRSMIQPCKQAIQYANKGNWEHRIKLPPGVSYRGSRFAPVSAMISNHHLESFLDEQEKEY